MKRFVVGGCWCGAILGWMVAMSATVGTSGPLSAVAVALTPMVALLLIGIFIAAAALRQQLLAGVALAVLMWSMVIASSIFFGMNEQPHPDTAMPSALTDEHNELVIVSSNVRVGNTEMGELIAGLQRQSPDVIVLQEIGEHELDAIRQTDLGSSHPFEIVDARPGFFGGAVFSRWPLTGAVEQIGGYPMIVATIESPAGPVEVVNVHVAPPISTESYRLWGEQLDALFNRLSSAEEPLVALGDFNATPQHRELRRLAEVTSDRGLGAFASFPTLMALPPVLSLDHAFSAGGVCIDSVVALPNNAGSDHRAMRAIVRHASHCPYEVPDPG